MRVRTGNPYNEAHGKSMRILEWIAPAETNPNDLPELIAKALPGVRLIASPDNPEVHGEVHGCINTCRTNDGSLYVSILLYDHGCDDKSCPHHREGTRAVMTPAPAIKESHHHAIKTQVGEHKRHKLGQSESADKLLLSKLGFGHHEHHVEHERLGTLPDKSLVRIVEKKPCPGCREMTDPPVRDA